MSKFAEDTLMKYFLELYCTKNKENNFFPKIKKDAGDISNSFFIYIDTCKIRNEFSAIDFVFNCRKKGIPANIILDIIEDCESDDHNKHKVHQHILDKEVKEAVHYFIDLVYRNTGGLNE